MNTLQLKFNQDTKLFIQENAYENIVWKMAAFLSLTQCAKVFWIQDVAKFVRYSFLLKVISEDPYPLLTTDGDTAGRYIQHPTLTSHITLDNGKIGATVMLIL